MSNGRLFVFGIGGTGARVIRSLTMLLAAGVNVSSEKIIPVMIDLDVQNADTNRTIKSLELYKQIRDKAYSEKPSEGFFATNLATLGSERNNDDNRIKESFSLSFGDINETFYEYLKAGQMSRENELLLHLLFDDSPKHSPTTELNLELSVGFKGNPNIGSIIFNDLVNTTEFKYFERSFREGDRIFYHQLHFWRHRFFRVSATG